MHVCHSITRPSDACGLVVALPGYAALPSRARLDNSRLHDIYISIVSPCEALLPSQPQPPRSVPPPWRGGAPMAGAAARVLHLDADAFFASLEQRDDAGLRGKPVAVGTCVVATCSYEARHYGVRTGMRLAEARRR